MHKTLQPAIDQAEKLDLEAARAHLTRFLLLQVTHRQLARKHWTVSEIAAHLGTGRVAVGRTLHSLARDGIIRQERGRLVVTNAAGLECEATREAND